LVQSIGGLTISFRFSLVVFEALEHVHWCLTTFSLKDSTKLGHIEERLGLLDIEDVFIDVPRIFCKDDFISKEQGVLLVFLLD